MRKEERQTEKSERASSGSRSLKEQCLRLCNNAVRQGVNTLEAGYIVLGSFFFKTPGHTSFGGFTEELHGCPAGCPDNRSLSIRHRGIRMSARRSYRDDVIQFMDEGPRIVGLFCSS